MTTQHQQLVKLLCNNDFYTLHSSHVPASIFDDELKDIFKTLRKAHEAYQRDISVDELEQLHLASKSGFTTSQKELLSGMFSSLRAVPDIGEDVAAEVIKFMYRTDIGDRIARYGIDLSEGTRTDVLPLREWLERTNPDFSSKKFVEPTTTDLTQLMQIRDAKKRWKFNLSKLAAYVPGLAEGELAIIFARPNAGKSLTAIHLSSGPAGFIEQGARVAYIVNEEAADRSMMRAAMSYLGLTVEAIRENMQAATAKFSAVAADKLFMLDDVTMSIDDVEAYVKRYPSDVLIIDQADKLSIAGSFDGGHDRLKALYVKLRQIAKVHRVAVIGVCQANAEAEGKTHLNYNMMDGSKTGKAGEADLILGIGKTPNTGFDDDGQSNVRFMNVCKNKITSKEWTFAYAIDPDVSRMVD